MLLTNVYPKLYSPDTWLAAKRMQQHPELHEEHVILADLRQVERVG